MILDTSVIIDLIRGYAPVDEKIMELDTKNTPLSTTTISIFEIWQGTRDMEDKERIEKINKLLESINVFNFDLEAAKEAGIIHALLEKKGKGIEPEDSMIAGIAKINNETILTRDTKHFNRIEGIKVETY